MSATGDTHEASNPPMIPLKHEDDLFGVFESAFRPGVTAVGIESERVGIHSDGRPLRFAGDEHHPGVQQYFDTLVQRYGWTPESEKPGAPALALTRDGASITLEPGSQFELSGAPHTSLHALARELTAHRAEMDAVMAPEGLSLLGVGFHPFARQEDLDWVPKARYPVMRAYLPTRGRYGLDMMRRTATVQANFDFGSEADAMRKLRVALAASPIITAIFDNSPVVEGKRTGVKSYRGTVWLDMDPDRTGLLPFAWRPDACIGDYVRWALDVPMFILKRGVTAYDATGLTFRTYMAQGLGDLRATAADWESHLNTLFPEVRLKRTLEVRGADSVPGVYAMALPALWTGILYDPECLAAVESLLVPYGHDAWAALRGDIVRHGLATNLQGIPLADLAHTIVQCSAAALRRRAVLHEGRDESVYLDALLELTADGRSVVDAVFGGWDSDAPDAVSALIARARF